MTEPRKVIHAKNAFDVLHIDTSHDPAGLLLEAFEQTKAKLMAAVDERGYIAMEDLRLTMDVSVVVQEGAKQ